MIFRTMKPGELDAWCAHCQEVFFDTPDGYFKRHYENDPDADPNLVFIAEEDGQIVSTIRVFRRTVRIGGRKYLMGGIGEVSTKEAYRGRGIASQLLNTAIEAMKKEGMALSILFGDKNIYSKSGYQTITAPYTVVSKENLPDLPEGAMIRPFETKDLDAVMGIYDLYAGRADTTLVRSTEYWKAWVLPQWEKVWVLEMEGRVVAYCEVRSGGRIAEMGAAAQFETVLPALLGACAEKEGLKTLVFQSALLESLPGERQEKNVHMILNLAPTEPLRSVGFFNVDDF